MSSIRRFPPKFEKVRLYEVGVGVGEEVGVAGGEEGVEEDGGGDLVDDFGSGAAVGVTGVRAEEGVGVVGGEALVEEVEGEGGVGEVGLEGGGEGLRFFGLGAEGAVGVERVADDDDLDVVLADEAGDGFEVRAEVGFGGGAVEGEQGLSDDAEGVGDGDADAAIADVQCESARVGHGFSVWVR
jgi:hypothetical protein